MPQHVITANRLLDGLVVYLTPDGGWSESINDSRISQDETELAAALETGGQSDAANIVTGVYEVEVQQSGADIVPVRIRERIRAYGPTTHRDFSRADVPSHFQHPDGVEAVVFRAAQVEA